MRHRYLVTLIALASAVAACGEKSTTSPSTPTAVVSVTYTPSPVPWSAGPGTTAACTSSANLWKFTYTFKESAGTAATITGVTPTTDGVAQSLVALSISVPANGQATVTAETCFATSSQHTLSQVFAGTDAQSRAITFNGSVVFAAR